MPENSRGESIGNDSMSNGHSSQEIASDFESLCGVLYKRVTTFLEEDVSAPILKAVQCQSRIALDVLKEALTRYSFDELCLSYNGGKDCLVLLVLYLATIHIHFHATAPIIPETESNHSDNSNSFPPHLNTVYIQPQHPFPEVDDFVQTSSRHYHLSLKSSSLPMKAAFAQYLEQNPSVKAIFVGTRRTDPHGANLTHFDPTDSGWPPFMRIHPVIDWHYAEIWAFIRHLDIPYCSLYDLGYTSLGGTNDTHPNPKLKVDGRDVYRPAYQLTEDDEERLGRDWHKKK